MPSLADITVKKFDGTTDQVWKGVIASAGDKNPAIFRNESIGSAPAHMPTFKLESSNRANGSIRALTVNAVYPETATATDGRVSVINKLGFKVDVTVPQGMDQDIINEGCYQIANLVASSLVKQCLVAGYAPT